MAIDTIEMKHQYSFGRFVIPIVCAIALLICAGRVGARSQDAKTGGDKQDPDAQAFLGLVAAERAFAKATSELGLRDGFLTFFAANALEVDAGGATLEPRLLRARERLVRMPVATRPLARRLEWEPRLGDVARAGDLGYLTGPFAVVDLADGRTVQHGLYTSVWKKQEDTTWKVLVDLGGTTPGMVDIGRAGEVTRDRVAPSQSRRADLTRAETEFARAARTNPARAYRNALIDTGRVYRAGAFPVSGTAAVAFVDSTFSSLSIRSLHSETAASDDLGFTLSAYTATLRNGAAERGSTLLIWKRAGERWRIVHEVISPSPAPEKD